MPGGATDYIVKDWNGNTIIKFDDCAPANRIWCRRDGNDILFTIYCDYSSDPKWTQLNVTITPNRPNYTFLGFSKSTSGTVEYPITDSPINISTIYDNTTFYERWEYTPPKFHQKFYSPDGSVLRRDVEVVGLTTKFRSYYYNGKIWLDFFNDDGSVDVRSYYDALPPTSNSRFLGFTDSIGKYVVYPNDVSSNYTNDENGSFYEVWSNEINLSFYSGSTIKKSLVVSSNSISAISIFYDINVSSNVSITVFDGDDYKISTAYSLTPPTSDSIFMGYSRSVGGALYLENGITNNVSISSDTNFYEVWETPISKIYRFFDYEYNLKYEISTLDDITSIYVGALDDEKVINVSLNGGDYTFEYNTESPIGSYEFKGFSNISPNNNANIPVGFSTRVYYTESTDFYEVWESSEEPIEPSNKFTLYLYNNRTENNRIDKRNYLTSLINVSGVLRDECSIIKPVIEIDVDDDTIFSANYVYIPKFKRYYYINNIESVVNGIWRIYLLCDVLMSHREYIIKQNALISRQEFEYNLNLIDGNLVSENQFEYEYIQSNTTAFGDVTVDNSDLVPHYVVSVVGGVPLG